MKKTFTENFTQQQKHRVNQRFKLEIEQLFGLRKIKVWIKELKGFQIFRIRNKVLFAAFEERFKSDKNSAT